MTLVTLVRRGELCVHGEPLHKTEDYSNKV